ncbi:hypothetical protein RIF29_24469 [Crotalaria pallida]|uniref:PPC domain-containing protein n=1 Tax=Crotalaria pallida TaxID=3830 RepID=A0AAN9I074_CROPI
MGSKSKPKPSIIVTEDNPNEFRSHAIEFSSGVDIAESLLRFARTRQRGLCVLDVNGSVINVTLQQASSSIMLLHGRFDIISWAGSNDWWCIVGSFVSIRTSYGNGGYICQAIHERLQSPTKVNDMEEQSGDVDNNSNESG